MVLRPVRFVLLLLVVVAGPACSPGIDLASSLEVTDVFSGYYDNGLRRGQNHLLPSITFRLKNVGTQPIAGVQLLVSFWAAGDDGERDSSQVRGIGDEALEPNAETEAITVRSSVGFTLTGPKPTFFQHSDYRDFTAKLFARRGGRITPIGEFVLDQRIIPQVSTSGAQ